ncbi:flavin reductase family protein [Oceanobacillus alkalisoli]|uniref:flavin reductase family protein n=1 Tax=Oceanobacillus alkalisoli TaxID=2925113 RepID=UPI001EF1489D|nr:flavin reductase family protein [Oceanobacillus alkalisoli]MCF3944307.1 flavin reductase family protein [Oceanobacillus alkalisoli]MCG5104898.1 flavin reductase family protein [Oceanobacillus alkalisoli]
MLSIHPQDQTERENYKLLIGSIIPRPIAFITTQSSAGIINAAPFSYFNIAATDPPMLAVSIQRKDDAQKDSAKNMMETKEFVIHIVDEYNVAEINKTAASLSPDESEIDVTELDLVESTNIAVPAVKQAKVRFECTLEKAVELGQTERITSDLIIGKVERFHIAEEVYEAGKINYDKLQAISRLAGHDYAKIGEIFTIERPK